MIIDSSYILIDSHLPVRLIGRRSADMSVNQINLKEEFSRLKGNCLLIVIQYRWYFCVLFVAWRNSTIELCITYVSLTLKCTLGFRNFFISDNCYLDHIGAGLYADSQMEAILADFKISLYSNPHSSGTSSVHCKNNIEQIRYRLLWCSFLHRDKNPNSRLYNDCRILEHFGTTPEDYHVIFTASATHSLKLVVECFNWGSLNGNCFLLVTNNFLYPVGPYL